MTLDNISPTIKALQGIISTSSSFGFYPPSTLTTAADSRCSIHLPPPPPIVDSLSALGLKPALVRKLSMAYEDSAGQLMEAFEANLNRMICACRSVDSPYGVPAINYVSLRTAILDVYMRSLQRMASDAFISVRRYLAKTKQNMIPRSLSPGSSNYRRPVLSQGPTSRCDLLHVKSRISKPMVMSSPTSEHNIQDDPTQNLLGNFIAKLPPHAYPVQYTHPQLPARAILPSSGFDFFAQRSVGSSLETPRKALRPDDLIAELNNVYIDGSRQAGDLKHSWVDGSASSNGTSTRVKQHPLFHHHTPSEISSRTNSSSRVSRRKIAPIPKHRTVCCNPPSSPILTVPTHQREVPDAPPSRFSFDCHSPQVLKANSKHHAVSPSTFSLTNGIPASQGRKRNAVPLPRRAPSTISSHRFAAPSPGAVDRLSTVVTSPYASMSRTPSLVSLSARSESPDPTDDGLDTPPPSPPTHTFMLRKPISSPSLPLSTLPPGNPLLFSQSYSDHFNVSIKREMEPFHVPRRCDYS